MKDKIEGLKNWADVDQGYWFAPKLFGWGATPVTWQGWALCLGFALLAGLDAYFIPNVTEKTVIGIALIAALVLISWRKTEGGWHWHWGLPKR